MGEKAKCFLAKIIKNNIKLNRQNQKSQKNFKNKIAWKIILKINLIFTHKNIMKGKMAWILLFCIENYNFQTFLYFPPLPLSYP